MKIYLALYNDMIEESSYATISAHKTKQGARNALAKHVREQKKEHDEDFQYVVKEMRYRFGLFERWYVKEIELLD